ncbi:HAD family hydrolase [Kitasatospora mediocidica]|uniref:HAD family hydrolase n=1 Tax=Kitasatospora mediocidica TaxID=58352 RepID=UPI00068C7617|nr:HAD family hydrolase [Kitasatospora mediocidica]
MVDVRALALDFGGTLARPGPRPDGAIVAEVLRGLAGTVVPDGFPAVFDAVGRRIRREDRARGVQSLFAEQLHRAARECGAVLPDLPGAIEALFTAVPDAEVDPAAADALRRVRRDHGGLRCVLACDTQRPESVRRRTLRAAGLADCFDALVLSSTVGARKPHRRFYDAVVDAAGCRPQEILFVGDTPAKDAIGPHAYGMRAVLVTPAARPDGLPQEIGVIGHFAELPGYLARLLRS